jgi:hypothetical protein
MIDGPRGLMPKELDELLEELVHVVYNPRMRIYFPTLFCEENSDNLRIIRADGKLVSHIGIVVRDMIINGCRITVGNVGAVCTLEEYRKRGYAWLILEDAMEKFRAEGVDMLLISGFRSLYKLHGATHVGKVGHYRIKLDAKLPEVNVEVKPFAPSDLKAWASLHRVENVRFHRPYDDFHKLAAAVSVDRRSLYSIWERGEITAYATIGKRGSNDNEIRYIDEYAGSRTSLLSAFRHWFGEFNAIMLGITVPTHDMELSGKLNLINAEVNYTSTSGTISILHFPRLCRKMLPMFEEIVGRDVTQRLTFQERDDLYVIGLDDHEAVFDNIHHIARLIFGNPADRDEYTEINAEGELREVLDAIFPIPRPEYGLSFI